LRKNPFFAGVSIIIEKNWGTFGVGEFWNTRAGCIRGQVITVQIASRENRRGGKRVFDAVETLFQRVSWGREEGEEMG